MRSPLLALFLALHYLLTGVLGGAWATRTREEAPTAARPFVHSVLCQTHNYLRLDCFDTCNGETPGQALHQLIVGDDHSAGAPHDAKMKVQVDVYLLADPGFVPVQPRYARALQPTRLLPVVAVAAGVFTVEGPPPKVTPAFAG